MPGKITRTSVPFGLQPLIIGFNLLYIKGFEFELRNNNILSLNLRGNIRNNNISKHYEVHIYENRLKQGKTQTPLLSSSCDKIL